MRITKMILCAIFLLGVGMVHAVSIFPNRIIVSGKPGERASIQIQIYGHPEPASVEFVKTDNIKEDVDTVLTTFELGVEQRYVIPIDIVIPSETKEYYLCAVLKKSQSMRLRVCSAVRASVKQ